MEYQLPVAVEKYTNIKRDNFFIVKMNLPVREGTAQNK